MRGRESKKAEGIHTLEVVFKETIALPRGTATLYQSPKKATCRKVPRLQGPLTKCQTAAILGKALITFLFFIFELMLTLTAVSPG